VNFSFELSAPLEIPRKAAHGLGTCPSGVLFCLSQKIATLLSRGDVSCHTLHFLHRNHDNHGNQQLAAWKIRVERQGTAYIFHLISWLIIFCEVSHNVIFFSLLSPLLSLGQMFSSEPVWPIYFTTSNTQHTNFAACDYNLLLTCTCLFKRGNLFKIILISRTYFLKNDNMLRTAYKVGSNAGNTQWHVLCSVNTKRAAFNTTARYQSDSLVWGLVRLLHPK
jgi:hypothetical protein